jgi:histidinol-phosphatase
VQKNPPSTFLGFLITAGSAVVVGLASVFLHRIGINAALPYGFIIAVLLLFCAGVQIRYYFGELLVYIFAVVCSITVYCLATLTTGDILVLGGAIHGEKPWAGYLGWGTIIGSFVFPFTASLIPERWLYAKRHTKQLKTEDDDMNLMFEIVEHTDSILKQALSSGKITAELKSDGTPVTQVDQEVEAYIRAQIAKKFPNDVILGEEMGAPEMDNNETPTFVRRWIIDPIDGTKNFIRGVPVFATLIALEELDTTTGVRKPTKSMVSAPALSTRWWATAKLGAWTQNTAVSNQPRKINTSSITELEGAFMSISSAGGWRNSTPEYNNFFEQLSSKIGRTRGFGDFYSYMLLAEGSVDIATEPDLELYDLAALIPVVENAGGVFHDVEGNSWATADGIKSARVSANPQLDKQLKEIYDSA